MSLRQRILALICVIGAVIAVVVTTGDRSSSQEPPARVSLETGALPAWPVIYQFTINGNRIGSVNDALSGADSVPPTDGASYSTAIIRNAVPNRSVLNVRLNWTEMVTGRHYEAGFDIDETDYGWFNGQGMPLFVTLEQHGAYAVRTYSEAWHTQPKTAPITMENLIVVTQDCANRMSTDAWNTAEMQAQLDKVFGHDAAFVEKHRDDPLPAALCPDPGR